MNCVAEHLDRTGISQREFAERLSVSQPTVSDWVNGKKVPDRDSVRKLAAELGKPPSEILADFYD